MRGGQAEEQHEEVDASCFPPEVEAFADAVDATLLAAVERVLGVSLDPSVCGTETNPVPTHVLKWEAEAASGSQKELTANPDHANSWLQNEVCTLLVACRERILLLGQLGAASGMWTVAIPTARTVMTLHELREVVAAYFFSAEPMPGPGGWKQSNILTSTEHNPGTVDLYGDALMDLPAHGDGHWRMQHDAIVDA
eukprot:jgi/Tetstr1/439422/TSEL_027856.t1